MRNNGALHSPMKNLRKDLYAVARDAEALLKATAEVTNDRVQEVRSRTEKTLRVAMEHLSNDRLRAQVRRVAENTDDYVRERPWAVTEASKSSRACGSAATAPWNRRQTAAIASLSSSSSS